MSESSNNPAGDRSGIAEAITTTLRQPAFLRVMLVLAATVVVLVGIRLGAPILNPIFFAVVLTLLVSPIYSWLLRRGLPAPLALVAMLVIICVILSDPRPLLYSVYQDRRSHRCWADSFCL